MHCVANGKIGTILFCAIVHVTWMHPLFLFDVFGMFLCGTCAERHVLVGESHVASCLGPRISHG